MALQTPWHRELAAIALRGLAQAAPYLARLAERSAPADAVATAPILDARDGWRLQTETVRLREIEVDPLRSHVRVREIMTERRFGQVEPPPRRPDPRLPAGALVATLVVAAPLVVQGIRLLGRQNARARQLRAPRPAIRRLPTPED